MLCFFIFEKDDSSFIFFIVDDLLDFFGNMNVLHGTKRQHERDEKKRGNDKYIHKRITYNFF